MRNDKFLLTWSVQCFYLTYRLTVQADLGCYFLQMQYKGTRRVALTPLETYRNYLYPISEFAEILFYTYHVLYTYMYKMIKFQQSLKSGKGDFYMFPGV